MSLRRRKTNDEDLPLNRERWMVSYADFITLLFALFVVMYAISTLSEGKYRILSEALTAAFRHEAFVAPPPGNFVPLAQLPFRVPRPHAKPTPAPPDPRIEQEEKLKGLAARISEVMNPLMESGQVRMRDTARGLAVEISSNVLFAAGQAVLQPESITALQQVVEVLRGVENPIEVEGHTDKQPIATSQYPSNWELSSARASAVIRAIESIRGVGKSRGRERIEPYSFQDVTDRLWISMLA